MPGIYVHIPFCASKCRYCDFVSFADHTDLEAYLGALKNELRLCAKELPALTYDTVFIGGGTPSILGPGAAADIMEALARFFRITPDAEITIETNPGTLSAGKLREYRAAGVNRLSMGLQSANDQVLKNIGRIHTYGQFLESYTLVREAGFDNVNADIMYGLPEQDAETHLDTIRKLAALGLEHISAYSLILEETTPLYTDVNGGAESLPDEDTAYEMHARGMELLEALGYDRYEISNYAKPGFCSKHNLNYWNNGEYLGLGLNSHSAMRTEGKWLRWSNAVSMREYIESCRMNIRPLAAEPQVIPKDEEMFETMMLGLRKTEGVNLRGFAQRFGKELEAVFPEAVVRLEAKGWLVIEDGYCRLTRDGLDFQNLALLELM